MKEKGFAITGILYVLLIIFLASMTMLLFNLQNRKMILDQLKLDVVEAVESDNNYEYLLNKISDLEAKITNNDQFHRISESASIISSTEMSSTGVKTTIPANSYFCVTATASYSHSIPLRIYIANSLSDYAISDSGETTYAIQLEASHCSMTTEEVTLEVFAQYKTSAQNYINLMGFYVN